MPNEYESMAKAMMSSPQGLKVIQTLDKLSAAAASPGGRQLISMLAGSGGDALKSAAAAASVTDKDPARVLISTLLATKDGASLVAKIIEVTGV